MKKITITAAILAAGLLGACTTMPDPVPLVSAFNGDSVTIRVNTAFRIPTAETRAKMEANSLAQATDICRRGHLKRAKFVSWNFYKEGDYNSGAEYLYLCLN